MTPYVIRTNRGSSIQILIIVIAVAVAVGFITCVVSHYKMGARSWSEQRRQRHQNNPSPSSNSEVTPSAYQIHNSVNNPVSTVLYVPPSNRRISGSSGHLQESNMRLQNSLQHNLDANYPTSISLPDGEEIPYGSWKNFRMRNADQQSEIYRECVKPPPNRTIFDGASPPPYRSKSVGILHAKKGGRSPPPTLVREEDRLPLVMRCHSMSTTSGSRGSAACSVNSNHKNNCSVLVLPSKKCNKNQSSSHQSTVQHGTLLVSPQIPSTTIVTSTNSELIVTPCSTGNQQTVIGQIDPPPDYSEVVANPSIYHSTATNRRHQNVL